MIITLKFNSICLNCGKNMNKGDEAEYTVNMGVTHIDCDMDLDTPKDDTRLIIEESDPNFYLKT